jgi:CHASE2 domain-containing sensor protein
VRLRTVLRQIADRPVSHWLGVALSLLFALSLVEIAGYRGWWRQADVEFYELLHNLQPSKPMPEVVVVEINDEEYWKGELAYRVPIRRDYLGHLLETVAQAAPEVIALDFDLRSPSADGMPLDSTAYLAENNALFESIKRIEQQANPPYIVLPATLGVSSTGQYVRFSDIYGQDCDALRSLGPRVTCGYIQLPYDHRQVPLRVHLAGGQLLDSFSVAVARAHNAKRLDYVVNGSLDDVSSDGYGRLPYADFPKPDTFASYSARTLLSGLNSSDRNALYAKVIFIGATWHTMYPIIGSSDEIQPPYADAHWSPVGDIPGVYLHATYAESLLQGRVFRPWHPAVVFAIDALLVLAAIVLFSLELKGHVRLAILALGVVVLGLLSYIAWSNLGVFFNGFLVLMALVVHFAVEQIRHWRGRAIAPAPGKSEGVRPREV